MNPQKRSRLPRLGLASRGLLTCGQPLKFSYLRGNARDSWLEQNTRNLVFVLFLLQNCPCTRAKSQPRPGCFSSRQEGRGDSRGTQDPPFSKLAMIDKNLATKSKQEMGIKPPSMIFAQRKELGLLRVSVLPRRDAVYAPRKHLILQSMKNAGRGLLPGELQSAREAKARDSP